MSPIIWRSEFIINAYKMDQVQIRKEKNGEVGLPNVLYTGWTKV